MRIVPFILLGAWLAIAPAMDSGVASLEDNFSDRLKEWATSHGRLATAQVPCNADRAWGDASSRLGVEPGLSLA
jgi:hypothetical protein